MLIFDIIEINQLFPQHPPATPGSFLQVSFYHYDASSQSTQYQYHNNRLNTSIITINSSKQTIIHRAPSEPRASPHTSRASFTPTFPFTPTSPIQLPFMQHTPPIDLIEVRRPAKILRPLKSKLDAKDGEDVVFECEVEGDGKVEWFKDGALIHNGECFDLYF